MRKKYAPTKASNYRTFWHPQVPIKRTLGVSLYHQQICFKKTMFPKAVWMPLCQCDQNFPLAKQSLGS